MNSYHTPVMGEEVLKFLCLGKDKIIVDATLGGGGHTKIILERCNPLKIIALDVDQDAIDFAKKVLGNGNIHYYRDNFLNIKKIIKKEGLSGVDGVIFDLGVSMHQVKTPERGFSYKFLGPLDMRMDTTSPLTAKDFILEKDETEIAWILKNFGEEPFAKNIARIIKIYKNSIHTTYDLKRCVEKAVPRKYLKKSLKRVFQAFRILVNNELSNLKIALPSSLEILNKGGRLVVITYHSIEDRIVKNFLKSKEKEGVIRLLVKKPIKPSLEEIKENPHSRSAKLRVGEKI